MKKILILSPVTVRHGTYLFIERLAFTQINLKSFDHPNKTGQDPMLITVCVPQHARHTVRFSKISGYNVKIELCFLWIFVLPSL